MSTELLFEKASYPRLGGDVLPERVDQASARGYAAGYAAGARAAAADAAVTAATLSSNAQALRMATAESVRSALHALETAVALANAMSRATLADADAALAAAALELAEAILGRELESHESSARAAVARALSIAADDEVVVVRMNPADIAVLGDELEVLTGARLAGDAAIDRGDAVLETPVGTIDARLSTAVDRVRAILVGAAA